MNKKHPFKYYVNLPLFSKLFSKPPNIPVQGSTLTFEGTCQVGNVNFNFYLPDTMLTCPAIGVIELT